MTENHHDIQQNTGGNVQYQALIYILFDANKADSLEKIKAYYEFIVTYNKSDKTIIKVIALRVDAIPSQEMKKTLTEVKSWAEEHRLIILEFNDDYANLFKDCLTNDAQTFCNYLEADPNIKRDAKKLEKMGIKFLQ